MKLIFYISIGLIFLAACKKVENEVIIINPKESKNSIQLRINKVLNDSTIELNWTKYTGNGFIGYRLVRTAEVLKNGAFSSDSRVLRTFSSTDSLVFVERDMPYSRKIHYSIYIITDPMNNLGSGVSYDRPTTYHVGNFNDALVNTAAKLLYLYNTGTGNIILYNYETNKEIKRISLNSGIGFCGLGDFEGGVQNELYVPTVHGWLYILDGLTLETKDKIYVGGERVTSVVKVAGNLFVSSSDRSYSAIDQNSLKVYDRKTKRLVGRTGYWNNTRLLHLEGSDIELIDITTNISPTDLGYYKFSSSGVPLEKRKDNYHGDHPLDASLVRSFPDGSKIITSGSGTIYTRDLKYEKDLTPPYSSGKYLDFAFNNSGTSIYGALKEQRGVEEIAYPSGNVTKTHTTLFYPIRLFRDGNQLICLTVAGQYSEKYFFIEKFNL
jgi:hypothetical protein